MALFLPLQAAQRQRQYAQALQLSTIFTPQAIINGRRSFLGSNHSGMVAYLDSQRDHVPVSLGISNGKLLIDLAEFTTHSPVDINVIAYLSEASTSVGRGENAGHLLHEFNIVRSFKSLGTWRGQTEKREVPLSNLPQDASHVAVLLQQPDQGEIVGAAAITIR